MTLTCIPGKKVLMYTNTFPARRYWVTRDTYRLDGRPLEGGVQTRRYRYRTEVITFHGSSCVLGRNTNWLLIQNGVDPAGVTCRND